MELWIAATLAAAVFQTVRFALQKNLKSAGLSAVGATWARFLWAAPILSLAVFLYTQMTGTAFPTTSLVFWAYAIMGGGAQILATVCVVALFSLRNFAIGITFKKSEVLQTVLVGWVILGEGVSWAGFVALLLGLVALLVLSSPGGPEAEGRTAGPLGVLSPSMLLGLTSGFFFALAGVGYRGATLALGDGPVGLRAAAALVLVTLLQAAAMFAWLMVRDRVQIARVLSAWRTGLAVGVTGLSGSFCWFVAFALQNAAYVYALGQVELLFSVAGGAVLFGERLTRREMAGIGLLAASLVVLVLAI